MIRTRRPLAFVATGCAIALAVVGCMAAPLPLPTPTATSSPPQEVGSFATGSEIFGDRIRALEETYAAHVGVMVIEAGSSRTLGYREDERFGYASSIKAFVAAALLNATDPAELTDRIKWTQNDVDAAGHAPVAAAHLATGLTLGDLAEAAVRDSDNAATNLVIRHLGGLDALDAALAAAGDDITDVSDYEPALNIVTPGSPKNTTTPEAFARTLQRIIEGEYLSDADRATLIDWVSGNASGDDLIRASTPAGWTVADKSGGADGIRNDIAVAYPPTGNPLVISILTAKNDAQEAYENQLVADVATAVFATAAYP